MDECVSKHILKIMNDRVCFKTHSYRWIYMKRIMALMLSFTMVGLLAGCAGMNELQQRGDQFQNKSEALENKRLTNQIMASYTEQLKHYMNNNDVEVPRSMEKEEENAQYEAVSTIMSQWIESVQGKTIDTGNFSQLYVDQYVPSILKMFKLNIFSPFEEETIKNNAPVVYSTAIKSILSFAMYLDGAIYKNYKDFFTGADLQKYYEFLLIAYQKDNQNMEQFIGASDVLKRLNIDENQVVTKKIFADFFVLMREATMRLVEDPQQYEPEIALKDDNDPSVQVLLMLNVYRLGQTNTVRPEHPLTFAEFDELLQRSLPYWEAFNQQNYAHQYMTNEEVSKLFVAIYERNQNLESQDKTEKSVDNDVDYYWYVSQLNTGEYSTANCIPACVAMIGRWYDETFNQTVEEIRANLIKNGEAWSIIDAQDQLVRDNIPYNKNAPSIEMLIQTIDQGGIALVAIDTQLVGHAVIVKGYEQRGQDTYLHIYDPALGEALDQYGQPMGANVIEHVSIFEYKMKQQNDDVLTFFNSLKNERQ